jgi:hypothetical protein
LPVEVVFHLKIVFVLAVTDVLLLIFLLLGLVVLKTF